MLSKNRRKLITSLKLKKYRDQHKLFTAEGEKLVLDLLSGGMQVESIYITDNCSLLDENPILISETEMKQISNFKTPSDILAVFKIPSYSFNLSEIESQFVLALDDIQDPGNLGTIVRLADWFGIENILCSQDTVDLYGFKAVQATMGAIARVKLHYLDLNFILKQAKTLKIPLYGTFLEGENIYQLPLTKNGIVIIGNEGKGISEEVSKLVERKLLIPPMNPETSESLNAAIATAIVCSEFRRNVLQ